MSDDLLVAILPNGVRGFISLACSDEDCDSFIKQTRGMGAMAWCRVPDTADFCEEAI